MIKYLLYRFISLLPTAMITLLFTFCIVRLAPGSPFESEHGTDPISIQYNERKYHLDLPVLDQFTYYVKDLLKGSLGPCYHSPEQSVSTRLMPLFWRSLRLGLLTFCAVAAVGFPLGWLSAVYRNSWFDSTVTSVLGAGSVLPGFIWVPFFLKGLGWITARGNPLYGEGMPCGDFSHLLLPIICLMTQYLGPLCNLVRSTVLEILNQNYMRYARAKGLPQTYQFFNHAFKPVLITVLPKLAGLLGNCLLGSAVIERIFSLAGIAQEISRASNHREYNILVTVLMLGTLIQLGLSWLTEVLQYTLSLKQLNRRESV